MTVTMQYLFQGWSCRMPGKYKDLIMDVATEEMARVEMIATMVAPLLEGAPATAAPNALFDEEYAEHATSVWHLSDGTTGHEGSWAAGPQPDGLHEFGYLLDPEPLGGPGSAPAPDPKLYATYDGKQGEPFRPGPRHRNRPGRKDQGRPHLIGWRKPAVTGTAAGLPDGTCGRPERRPQAPDRRKE
jgi:Mn-containing catalase